VYPAIDGAKLFDAMKSLESYTPYEGGYSSPYWDLPFQLRGCTYKEGGKAFEKGD